MVRPNIGLAVLQGCSVPSLLRYRFYNCPTSRWTVSSFLKSGEMNMKQAETRPLKTFGRVRYLMCVLVFAAIWGILGAVDPRHTGKWQWIAFAGTMCVLTAWGWFMRLRILSTDMPWWITPSIAIALLPAVIVAANYKIIGGSSGIFIFLFLVQLPAMLWPAKASGPSPTNP
jgi:hypothetical protein